MSPAPTSPAAQTHPRALPASAGLALCHHQHSSLSPWLSARLSCVHTCSWQAAASSPHLTSGCLHWLWVKEQGCTDGNMALPCSQSMAQLPNACIPQWYLKLRRDPETPVLLRPTGLSLQPTMHKQVQFTMFEIACAQLAGGKRAHKQNQKKKPNSRLGCV